MRAFGRETNFVPKRIPNLLPSGFQGVYLASWGALIRPASHNRHTRPKGQRGVSTTILNMYYTSSEGSAVLLWEHNRNLGGSHRSHSPNNKVSLLRVSNRTFLIFKKGTRHFEAHFLKS